MSSSNSPERVAANEHEPDAERLTVTLQRIESIAANEEIEYADAVDRIWKLAHDALGTNDQPNNIDDLDAAGWAEDYSRA